MSEAKFTKGEWELNKYTSTVNGDTRVFAYDIWCGDKCIVHKTDIEYPCEDLKKEYLANAHLIAAAPEMYALLERAKEVMLYTYDVTDYPADGNTDCDVCAREIDALLDKARGK